MLMTWAFMGWLSSGGEELPLPALTEPCVNLSIHTAPSEPTFGITPNDQ